MNLAAISKAVPIVILMLYSLCSVCSDRLVASMMSPRFALSDTDRICATRADHRQEHACTGSFAEHVASQSAKISADPGVAMISLLAQNQTLPAVRFSRLLSLHPPGSGPPVALTRIKLRI